MQELFGSQDKLQVAYPEVSTAGNQEEEAKTDRRQPAFY
jgi:hypothetical protein